MTMTATKDRLAQARDVLDAAGQGHVLQFYDELDDASKSALLDQIGSVDWPELARLVQTHVLAKPALELPHDVKPAPWYPFEPTDKLTDKYETARTLGEKLLRDGKVAAFTVAGGQGTRLGWPGPKGTFPATAIRKLSLFGCFAEYIQKVERKYDRTVPWYLMTSPINDADTKAFFKKNHYFGVDSANVMIFPQAMMPAFDIQSGKVLMEDRATIALSPNGHGGSLKALFTSGAIADMQQRGIEQISYFQVDNPIVKVIDPLFIGLHAMDEAQMSSKMLPKREPLEKLGNFCLVDGKMAVIEYSDLPEHLAHERAANGDLRFRAGSIAIHAIRVDFVASLNKGDGFSLPFHRAEKKVAYLDLNTQQPVKPTKPNAVKLEMFVFDALPMCDKSIIYETDRVEEFAPIKNADSPDPKVIVADSPAESLIIQTERNANWLELHAVDIPRKSDGSADAVIEISPLTAIEAGDLNEVSLPDEVKCDEKLLL